ncbi:hypothetical protein BU26DRAFT_16137 [Trematosphaeria pertusa]|uniref:Uncharacterized protein n=1 Tax=Trematosphaeria pertusa TaxID=390896 RepID=A0A6A6J2Q4_9PLEO|nr:uncharacterized protein BU26DRAFT_16137 [Trematosphaeria pertusa]KAF2256190.1 hypothetical protein BU26DRAFT_16137 [Trematosphaeria pertusa]
MVDISRDRAFGVSAQPECLHNPVSNNATHNITIKKHTLRPRAFLLACPRGFARPRCFALSRSMKLDTCFDHDASRQPHLSHHSSTLSIHQHGHTTPQTSASRQWLHRSAASPPWLCSNLRNHRRGISAATRRRPKRPLANHHRPRPHRPPRNPLPRHPRPYNTPSSFSACSPSTTRAFATSAKPPPQPAQPKKRASSARRSALSVSTSTCARSRSGWSMSPSNACPPTSGPCMSSRSVRGSRRSERRRRVRIRILRRGRMRWTRWGRLRRPFAYMRARGGV